MLVFVLFCSKNCQSRVYSCILDACEPQSVDKLQLTAVGGTLDCTWNKFSYKKIIQKIAFVKFLNSISNCDNLSSINKELSNYVIKLQLHFTVPTSCIVSKNWNNFQQCENEEWCTATRRQI